MKSDPPLTMTTHGSTDKHHVNGTVNGGGPTIKAETGSGDIHIQCEEWHYSSTPSEDGPRCAPFLKEGSQVSGNPRNSTGNRGRLGHPLFAFPGLDWLQDCLSRPVRSRCACCIPRGCRAASRFSHTAARCAGWSDGVAQPGIPLVYDAVKQACDLLRTGTALLVVRCLRAALPGKNGCKGYGRQCLHPAVLGQGVLWSPGSMITTRIPNGLTSMRRLSLRPSRANFEALYIAW